MAEAQFRLRKSLSYGNVSLSRSSNDFYPIKRFRSVTDLTTPVNYYEAKLEYKYRPYISKYSRNYVNPNNDLWYGCSRRYYPERYYPTRRLEWYEDPYSYYSPYPKYRHQWIDSAYRRSYYNSYNWPNLYWSSPVSRYDHVYGDDYLYRPYHYSYYYYTY